MIWYHDMRGLLFLWESYRWGTDMVAEIEPGIIQVKSMLFCRWRTYFILQFVILVCVSAKSKFRFN